MTPEQVQQAVKIRQEHYKSVVPSYTTILPTDLYAKIEGLMREAKYSHNIMAELLGIQPEMTSKAHFSLLASVVGVILSTLETMDVDPDVTEKI